jgi:hypothetical protein
MPTLDYTVAASSDDAQELGGTVSINTAVIGTIDATNEYAGLRWDAVTIPDGATIDVAYIRLNVTVSSADEPQHTIHFENADAPATFVATNNNINTRTMTSASVVWDNADLGANGTDQYFNSPSLVSIIQELMAARSYASGRAMVCRIQGGSSATRDLQFTSWDNSPTTAPVLHIEYTAGGGGRTTKNTRSHPLGTRLGMGRRMPIVQR